jgi:hypothetical protein
MEEAWHPESRQAAILTRNGIRQRIVIPVIVIPIEAKEGVVRAIVIVPVMLVPTIVVLVARASDRSADVCLRGAGRPTSVYR